MSDSGTGQVVLPRAAGGICAHSLAPQRLDVALALFVAIERFGPHSL